MIAFLERVEGIKPSHSPWQGDRLSLHHTRIIWRVRKDSNPHLPIQLRYSPFVAEADTDAIFIGWRRRSRTYNLRLQRPLLYQLSYTPMVLPRRIELHPLRLQRSAHTSYAREALLVCVAGFEPALFLTPNQVPSPG